MSFLQKRMQKEQNNRKYIYCIMFDWHWNALHSYTFNVFLAPPPRLCSRSFGAVLYDHINIVCLFGYFYLNCKTVQWSCPPTFQLVNRHQQVNGYWLMLLERRSAIPSTSIPTHFFRIPSHPFVTWIRCSFTVRYTFFVIASMSFYKHLNSRKVNNGQPG